MSLRRPLEFALVALLALSFMPSVSLAKGTGLWRLPSSTAQYFGYGYGPGHHAPMIRSPGYQPPQVQRLKFIPAKQGPFCPTGHCQMASGYQSLPIQADLWALDAMSAPMHGVPQPILAPQYAPPYPQGSPPQAPVQSHPVLFPSPERVQPRPTPAPKPTEEKPSAAKPLEKKETLPTPSPTEESDEDDLLGDDLISDEDFDMEEFEGDDQDAELEEDLDEDEPAMPDAEPLPQPKSKDETPRTDQARGPRIWNCR